MGTWVDLKRLTETVPIGHVLSRYQIQLRAVNNSYMRGNCPLPSHSREASAHTFAVNIRENFWCCKSSSCVNQSGKKGGDVIDFVALMEGCSAIDAAKKLLEWFPSARDGNRETPQAETAAKAVANESLANKPLPWELRGIHYHPYLESRQVSKDLAARFGVGFFPGTGSMRGRIVIPIRNEKAELVAYAGRAIGVDEKPKYKLPRGFRKSLVVYNLDSIGDQVEDICVVEGFFDCMRVTEAGYPCVALMGNSLSNEQAQLLAGFKSIVLMLDGDEPGREATLALLPKLAASAFVKVITLPPDAQPDSLPLDEIRRILS
jgi:DNA primase